MPILTPWQVTQPPLDLPAVIEYKSVILPNTTGSYDIQVDSAVGFDETPIAAFFFTGQANALTSSSENRSTLSIGAYDGTNQWASCVFQRDGQGTMVSRMNGSTSWAGLTCYAGGHTLCTYEATALIANGVRINVISHPGAGNPVGVVVGLVFARGGSALAGTFSPHDTHDNSVAVSVGFMPDMVMAMTNFAVNMFPNTANVTGETQALGFALKDETQVSLSRYYQEGVGTANIRAQTAGDRVLAYPNGSAHYEFHTFTSSGFSCLSSNPNVSGNKIGYLAIKAPSAQFKVGTTDTPTSTGNHDVTGLGFQAAGGILLPSYVASPGSEETDSDAEAFGVSVLSNSEIRSMWVYGRDNVGTSDVYTRLDHQIDTSTFANTMAATFSGGIAGGFRLNFTDVEASSKNWPFLAYRGF